MRKWYVVFSFDYCSLKYTDTGVFNCQYNYCNRLADYVSYGSINLNSNVMCVVNFNQTPLLF